MGITAIEEYRASYVDLVVAGSCERGTVTLVAGSHTRSFPYFETEPWDNCLLQIGDAGYTFTGRIQGAALRFEFDVDAAAPRGAIRFSGEMRRASDGAAVAIELDLPIALAPQPTRKLGESYNVLELEGMLGLAWTPYALTGEPGRGARVRIDGAELAISDLRGSCERGVLTNLRARELAIAYDYLAVACPGDDGYGVIQFTSHALHRGGVIGGAVDWYLRSSASASMTIDRGGLRDGNPRGVYRPPDGDPAAVRFETEVDLGPAVLKRQMVETRDRAGRALFGLREIFVAKPEPPRRRFHLNRAQVNGFLFLLVVLDVVLSAIAIGYPDRWFQLMHAMPYDDPAGLLRRTGATWIAFVLIQAIALVRWQRRPYWLAVVAGVRFTELFSDWTTLIAAKQMTLGGTLGLLISPPANLIFGVVLISTYLRLQRGPIPHGAFFTRPWS
jgi:hypothetical protein